MPSVLARLLRSRSTLTSVSMSATSMSMSWPVSSFAFTCSVTFSLIDRFLTQPHRPANSRQKFPARHKKKCGLTGKFTSIMCTAEKTFYREIISANIMQKSKSSQSTSNGTRRNNFMKNQHCWHCPFKGIKKKIFALSSWNSAN